MWNYARTIEIKPAISEILIEFQKISWTPSRCFCYYSISLSPNAFFLLKLWLPCVGKLENQLRHLPSAYSFIRSYPRLLPILGPVSFILRNLFSQKNLTNYPVKFAQFWKPRNTYRAHVQKRNAWFCHNTCTRRLCWLRYMRTFVA